MSCVIKIFSIIVVVQKHQNDVKLCQSVFSFSFIMCKSRSCSRCRCGLYKKRKLYSNTHNRWLFLVCSFLSNLCVCPQWTIKLMHWKRFILKWRWNGQKEEPIWQFNKWKLRLLLLLSFLDFFFFFHWW